ncbi:TSUP family transporter [Cognatishimia sp.]|uniref:TSUP family transporter n=1 Tax=Cognatishimia sp. TaxID=2211648 RepID=UPI003514121E|nr:sulfite exporter TauE/SafE family protein [Cognatishimia sp.]
MLALPFGFSSGEALFVAVALFGAAVIRGLSGFGFSAIFVLFAALVTNPLRLIPVVFSCEILMTIFQAKGIGRHIAWRRAITMLIGAGIATVPAIYIMARLDDAMARLVISGLILCLCALLFSGWQIKRPVGDGGHVLAGMVSGTANSAGVGGLPIAGFMAAQPIPPAVFRATMIVFLTGIDMMALPVMAMNGLVGPDLGVGILFALPIIGAGVWVGSLYFERIPQNRFRQGIIVLMTLLAVANIARLVL